jgi:hypothetical protein
MGPRLPARRAVLISLVFAAAAWGASAQDQPQPGPILQELSVEGATVFTADDVLWLLRLRRGEPLPGPPERIAELLAERYQRDGYAKATVEAEYDSASGRLVLLVDEGRIDAVEFDGISPSRATRLAQRFRVRAGDVYNGRTVRRAVNLLRDSAQGALRFGDVDLVDRGGKRILVVPVDERGTNLRTRFSSNNRIELFNPVDGLAPSLSFELARFDHQRFNHTFVSGTVGYAFAREEPAYALGFERPFVGTRRVFAGAELYDLTASDDDWRISTGEQSLVALTFRNTFKDYYRRRGVQAFAAVRPHDDHEFVGAMRWDRHEPLSNESDFSLFRDDHPYRENLAIAGGRVRALVLAYTFDTRGLLDDEPGQSYERHTVDDLFRGSARQAPGARIDWTTEIAGYGLGGEYEFDRHILNARLYLPLSARQSIAARLIAGSAGGAIPPERRFALGGIGSVRGYAFKEATGERMALTNVEYRLDLTSDWRPGDPGSLRLLLMFDAGRVQRAIGTSTNDWLRGAGFGVQTGPLRVEFGYRLDDIPRSRQILVRLAPTF